MGLFSPSKTVVVSSVVYNMAGDEEDRPQYLSALITRNVLSGTKDTIGDTINTGYLTGPAIKLRSFYRWAQRESNYGLIGLPTGRITNAAEVDPNILQPILPHDPAHEVWVQKANIGPADPSYWADQWVTENRPEMISDDFVIDYNEHTNEITIDFTDLTQAVFTPTDFDSDAQYLYAYWIEVTVDEEGAISYGPVNDIGEGAFPDISEYELIDETLTNHPVSLDTTLTIQVEVLKEYSNGDPDVYTSDTDVFPNTESTSYDTFVRTYRKGTYYGGTDDILTATRDYMILTQDATVGPFGPDVEVTEDVVENEDTPSPGVTETVTTTTTTTTEGDRIIYDRSYQTGSSDVIVRQYSQTKVYIYKIGSGEPTLDALVEETLNYGTFFPFIPVRIANDFLSDVFHPDEYEQARKAYKKATGSKFKKLIDKVAQNDDLEDIDNVYVVFGVSFNVIEEASRRYIYRFFKEMMNYQNGGEDAYEDWKARIAAEQDVIDAWMAWKANQGGYSGGHDESTLDDPEPPRPVIPAFSRSSIRINPSEETEVNFQFDMDIAWSFIASGSGIGLGKPGAKKNDCWIEYLGEDELTATIYAINGNTTEDEGEFEKVRIYLQTEVDAYEYMDIVGAVHRNYVYKGKSVVTTAHQALIDADESGFIVPLHYDIYRSMSIKDASQMATACVFIVFNCYEIHKQKWYETFIFRIIVVIVIAILSVVFTGGTGLGILGTHMSVGSALGFSGMTAAIVGSIANAMAALVISTIIEKVTTAFGPLGQIIGFLFMAFMGSFQGSLTAGNLTLDWGNLLSVDNLLGLTNAVGKTISGFIQQDTQKMIAELQSAAEKANREAKKIQETYLKEFGYNNTYIDPMMFVESANIVNESSDTFLTRTLMTGSDVAQLSTDLLTNFATYTLSLDRPFA
jgi:hypothetical protein